MMKKIKQFSVVLAVILAMPLVVLAQPAIPLLVYGNVTIDNSPAPVGTVITIEKNSTQILSTSITTEGKYFIEVPAENAGETLTYKVNGTAASQKACLNPTTAPSDRIDLAITTSEPEPDPTPASDDDNNNGGGGGGGGGGGASDTTPPTNTSILINNNAETTVSAEVVLSLSAIGANQMMVANSSSFSGKEWEGYATQKNWSLTAGNGEKTVYVKFKDSAGNISTAVSDTIVLAVEGQEGQDVLDTPNENPSLVQTPPTIPQVLGVEFYANGSLLRGPDKRIYVLVNGQKKYISSLIELQKYAGRPTNNVASSVIAQYPDYQASAPAPTVAGVATYANGSLLRGPDKKIYVLINGQKKHIPNLVELQKYAGQPTYNVSDTVIAQYASFGE